MRALLTASLFATLACSTPIKGHKINDSKLNREVVALMEAYRGAMEARDAERVLSYVAEDYFEDQGNTKSDDDYGRKGLKKRLDESFAQTGALHMRLKLLEVLSNDSGIAARMSFEVRYRFDLPSGSRWERHKDVNEVLLVRRGNNLKIKSGL
jgi:hypothetical protein